MIGAITLLALGTVASAIAVMRVNTLARWKREEPRDEDWIDQLKSFNSTQVIVRAKPHQPRRQQQRRHRR